MTSSISQPRHIDPDAATQRFDTTFNKFKNMVHIAEKRLSLKEDDRSGVTMEDKAPLPLNDTFLQLESCLSECLSHMKGALKYSESLKNQWKTAYANVHAQFSQLKEIHESLLQSHSKEKAASLEKLHTSQRSQSELQTLVGELKKSLEELKEENTRLSTSEDEALAAKKAALKDREKLRDELKFYEATPIENNQLRLQLDKAKSTIKSLNSELKKTKDELEATQNKLEESQKPPLVESKKTPRKPKGKKETIPTPQPKDSSLDYLSAGLSFVAIALLTSAFVYKHFDLVRQS